MGCLPCKHKRHNLKSVKHASGEETHRANAHELTTVTSIEEPIDEIAQEAERGGDDSNPKTSRANQSKLPGTVDDAHRDEASPLLPTSNSNANVPASSALVALAQTEEDLQHAEVIQAVVRAYIMRKARLKEDNTPFAELMTSHHHSNLPIDDTPILIPQVPRFRSNMQQPPSSQFQHQPSSMFQHPPSSHFQPATTTTHFQHPPSTHFQHLPSTHFQLSPSSHFQHPPSSHFQHLPSNQFQHPPSQQFQTQLSPRPTPRLTPRIPSSHTSPPSSFSSSPSQSQPNSLTLPLQKSYQVPKLQDPVPPPLAQAAFTHRSKPLLSNTFRQGYSTPRDGM